MRFIELLNEHRIPYKTEGHHHCRPGWIQFDCPYCGPGSQHWHMGFNEYAGYVNCWRCGKHYLADVIARITGSPYHVAKKIAKELGGSQPAKEIDRRKKNVGHDLILPKGCGPLKRAHKDYLRQRGFDPDKLVDLWQIRATGWDSDLPWRIIIPVIYHGEIVSWTSRAISDNAEPRYLTARPEQELLDHRRVLYGEDYCRHSCIVVEGPIDAWRIGPGAIATCGLGFSRSQALLIGQYLIRAICFDNEPQARRRAEKLASFLSSYPGETYICKLETGKDAAEADESEIRQLRKLLQ